MAINNQEIYQVRNAIQALTDISRPDLAGVIGNIFIELLSRRSEEAEDKKLNTFLNTEAPKKKAEKRGRPKKDKPQIELGSNVETRPAIEVQS